MNSRTSGEESEIGAIVGEERNARRSGDRANAGEELEGASNSDTIRGRFTNGKGRRWTRLKDPGKFDDVDTARFQCRRIHDRVETSHTCPRRSG